MVVDRLENLEKYASLNPLFAKAMEYLKTTDLNAQELGKVKLQGDDLVVNFSQTKPKTKEEVLSARVQTAAGPGSVLTFGHRRDCLTAHFTALWFC